MDKASAVGRSWADMGRSWASGLKFKQWLRWVSGEGSLPDTRARKLMAGTVGLLVVLLALGSLILGGGGGGTGAKKPSPSAQYFTSGTSPERSGGAHPKVGSFLPPTTSATSTTTTARSAQGATVARRTRVHPRHTTTQRPRVRSAG